MIGQSIGHYRVLGRLGAGGMGEVYLAEDTRLHRNIALKVLPPELAARPDRLKRFEREAQTLAALDHPNIVTIHSVEESDGIRFLTMAHIEGETLEELIPAGGFPLDRFLELALPLTEGLCAAHERGIVHRDLKPANVMVDHTGRLRILDFGVARLQPELGAGWSQVRTETARPAMTQEGAILGSYPYMSPEQIEAKPADARSDIFSLGAVLFEMATEGRAFRGDTPASLISSILKDDPGPLADARPDLPLELGGIVSRCLAKDPADRFQSAVEVRDALADLARRVASREALVSTAGVARFTSSRSALTLAAVLVMLSTAAALWLWMNQPPSANADRIDSLAVLPLRNLTGDPEQQYFVDGMTEALTTDLSKLGALTVISSTSAMRYRASDKSLPQIASELGVDAIVEGSVIREGDNVRITAQLIDASTDRHLWADSFEREIRSVLALQGQIAKAVAQEIEVTLTPEQERLLTVDREVDPEAYEAYLKGTFHLNKLTPDGIKQGLAYLHEAVDKDPGSALALARLALGYSLIASHSPEHAPPDAFQRAQAAYTKALARDDKLAEAHAAVAETKLYREWDWEGAERSFRRALDLNPNIPRAHAHYAWYLNLFGHDVEAVAEMKRAQQVDPLNPLWAAWIGDLHSHLGKYETAVAAAQQALELNPEFPWALYSLGRGYAGLGEYDKAIDAQNRAVELDPSWQWALGVIYAKAGLGQEAREIAVELEEQNRPSDTLFLALIHAALGNREETLRWIEAAVEVRHRFAPWLFRDIDELDLVEDAPRYLALWKQLRLPLTVSVSSSPSRTLAAALGYSIARRRAKSATPPVARRSSPRSGDWRHSCSCPTPQRRRHGLEAAGVAPRGHAHQHLLHDPAIQRIDIGHGLERWQRHLRSLGSHTRPAHRHLPAAEDHFTPDGSGPRGATLGHMRIARPATPDTISSGMVSSTFRPEGIASANNSSGRRRSHRPAAGGGEIQQRPGERLCETSSWRLLVCEAFASGLVTTRVSRAATEPPLQFSTAIGTSPHRLASTIPSYATTTSRQLDSCLSILAPTHSEQWIVRDRGEDHSTRTRPPLEIANISPLKRLNCLEASRSVTIVSNDSVAPGLMIATAAMYRSSGDRSSCTISVATAHPARHVDATRNTTAGSLACTLFLFSITAGLSVRDSSVDLLLISSIIPPTER